MSASTADAPRFEVVSVGGGLGSFTLVDILRIAGVPSDSICVIGPHRSPIHQYETSLDNSGIGPQDRLRSESCSTLDNPWGFPGYAMREALQSRRTAPLLRTLGEATVAEYYTPRRCDVVASVTREAERISWREMHRAGLVESIRREHGHYVVDVRGPDGEWSVRTNNVHLALGPGPRRSPSDSQRVNRLRAGEPVVFHVYENHDLILRQARARRLTVAVRGGGIAASHAVDRLLVERERSAPDLRVIHLTRHEDPGTRQAFNVPKAAWGGQYLESLVKADDARADELLRRFATTTIPARSAVARRRYRAVQAGALVELVHPDPRLSNCGDLIAIDVGDDTPPRLADYAIDATGFESGVSAQPVVDSLLTQSGVAESRFGRIDVDDSFAAVGLDTVAGRAYVSGSLSFGKRYGAPDTFLGLHFCGHHIAHDLARRGIGRSFRADRSIAWWARWALGLDPTRDHEMSSSRSRSSTKDIAPLDIADRSPCEKDDEEAYQCNAPNATA